MTPTDLTDETRRLYKARPANVSSRQVAAGAKVPYGWLQDFGYSRTQKPNKGRVQLLHDYLVALRDTVQAGA